MAAPHTSTRRFAGAARSGVVGTVVAAVAYALPYVAMWSIVGLALGETISAT
jgi:hypothetical protein